jgi:putative tricarboxylic transport membrane protein
LSDRIFGGVCVVLAAAYVYFALQVQTAFISDPLGPKAFPVIIGVILAIGGIYAIARPDADPSWPGLGGCSRSASPSP